MDEALQRALRAYIAQSTLDGGAPPQVDGFVAGWWAYVSYLRQLEGEIEQVFDEADGGR